MTKNTGEIPVDHAPYQIVISRLTVDKLGVKLYDKVSAVVAELISNAYDADAETVTVRLPLGTKLSGEAGDGKKSGDYVIEVADDGHGMTPEEAIAFYMKVGRDRREHEDQGRTSRRKKRPVMGRKGIGKLAPFGICRTIEVLSSGGDTSKKGYLTSHFLLEFDRIVRDEEGPVDLRAGKLDGTFASTPGTTIRLHQFLPKKVPPADVFHRQLARRFVFAEPKFRIVIEDTRDPTTNPPIQVATFQVPLMDGTRIDVSERPVPLPGKPSLPVTGWLGLAKEAYKDEEMAGVRIYARNKIVATTRDFEQPAGFTGEFTTRSYLVGQVHAEWLDEDKGEDLIRTDRQGILWDSDFGQALREWGANLIQEIGAASRKPRRDRVRSLFFEMADFEKKVKERFGDTPVAKAAVELGRQIGGFAAEDELKDEKYIAGLVDVILSVAPHKALIEALKDFQQEGGEGDVGQLVDLFGKARVAELASYAQIAHERVKVIEELETVIEDEASNELALQNIIADAPWLIHPTWTIITANRALKEFKRAFEAWWKTKTGHVVVLAIEHETKRPDFTLISVDGTLHIVEIKAAGHAFDENDFTRLNNYADAFEEFFSKNKTFESEFSKGWQIELVADDVRIKDPVAKRAFKQLKDQKRLEQQTWADFLLQTKKAHETFLEVHERAERKALS